jgi:anti-anti-sigma factor
MSPGPPAFDIREREDPDGALRLTVLGELDLATTPSLDSRFDAARLARRSVRLDLSQLAFIDSTGLHTVLRAIRHAQTEHLFVKVDPFISRPVAAVLRLSGVDALLWPDRDVEDLVLAEE